MARPDVAMDPSEFGSSYYTNGTNTSSASATHNTAYYWDQMQNYYDQWNKNASVWRAEYQAKYQPQIVWGQNYLGYDPATGTYDTSVWPQYQSVGPYTNAYQGSLDSLLARLQGGTTASDTQAARDQMLSALGMTEEQYAQISGNAYQTAEEMQARADAMATTESDAYKKYNAMIQSQQKSAVAAMGKQLETIFANRGGLGAFSQAYEMTSSISDQALQYQTQYLMDRSAEAIQLIQAENTRNVNIMQSSAELQKEFLNDNWTKLQTAFQDTMTAANAALQEYQTRADVNAQDYQMNLQAFLAPINAMKDMINLQLGIDESTFEYMESVWDETIGPLVDMMTGAEAMA